MKAIAETLSDCFLTPNTSSAFLPVATASTAQTANAGIGPGLRYFILKLLCWAGAC